MDYQNRLQDMQRNGTISTEQARQFSENLEKLAVDKAITVSRHPVSYLKVSLCIVLMLVIGVFAISVTTPFASDSTQTVQNVANSLNQQGATGRLPDAANAMLSVFLLLSIPATLTMFFVANRYNTLITLDESTQKTGAFIASATERKTALLPALQKLVESAMQFEETLQHSTAEARTSYASSLRDKLQEAQHNPQRMPTFAETVHAVVEAYPPLRSHDNLTLLQQELGRVEQELHIARTLHAESTADLNACTRGIFGGWVARLYGMKIKPQTIA